MATRLPALVVVALVLAWGADAGARTPRTPCTGRFAIAPGEVGLLGDETPSPVVLEVAPSGEVTLDACGTTPARLRAKKRATTFRARWADCGAAGRVVLIGKVPSPACDALSGAVKRPRTKRVRFTATLIACGNGRVDPGEPCDESAPAGDAACPGACTACACAPTTTSTTSTSTTTSTTTTTGIEDAPIVASEGVWTWVDFPNSTCDEGSTTGIGVNLANSPNVAIILGFGGACWDATTCWVENTAAHGPFGPGEFSAAVPFFANTILDRSLAGNPFASWNLIVAPYCTGDLHAGDNTVLYDTGGDTHLHHHAGNANLLAFLRRLVPTFPTPTKVVLGGLSAGGFGALFNYPDVRARWPTAQAYVLDDSGPLLEPASFPSAFIADWFTNWRLDLVTDPICGVPCRSDLSLVYPGLAALYPNDRMALLSSLQDAAIRDIYGISALDFETAILDVAADRIDPTGNVRYFLVAGESHPQLLSPGTVSQNGVALLDWLTDLVNDDPGWASVKP